MRLEQTNSIAIKNELNDLFRDCVETTRKEILRARKTQSKTVYNQQFEESLLKLAQYGKGNQTYDKFTERDRYNIVDLFVNNQATLNAIYHQLFESSET